MIERTTCLTIVTAVALVACGSDFGMASSTDGGSTADSDADGDASDAASDASPTDSASDVSSDAPFSCDAATAMAITCNGQCVDGLSPAHCGSCTNVCTAPANGHATCTAPSTCGIACDMGFHTCGGGDAGTTTCLPDTNEPSADACVVSDALGVFVAPNGSDSAACTKAAPCKTIAHGISVAHAASKRVYVCEGTYDEQLVVDASVDGAKVFGGFACGTWTYDANKKPVVAPSAHGNALVLSGTTSALFEDFAFQAQGGSAPGESSMAIFAKNAQGVVLKRCNVTAGAGIAGQDQMQPAPYSSAAPNGNPGTLTNGGGVMSNPACSSSNGGAGGPPGPADGNDGTPGASNKGTVGGCQMSGTSGGNGTTGSLGSVGLGTTAWATFSASGWTPAPGGAGGPGTVGQGGGGGASLDLTGGGGGGGAGGCGGSGGGAGGGAGSSVAILSLSSTVDLQSSVVSTANAGRGGNGAAGQAGQTGGGKGNGFGGSACNGGRGGAGGQGGIGGGGAGGLSAGIVWLGTAPTVNGVSTPSAATLSGFSFGTAGSGGTGGSTGKAGIAAAVVQFQ